MTLSSSRRPLLITQREEIARDIHWFELRDPQGQALPPFEPGAHVQVQTPCGLVRPYSLCNDPQDTDRYCIGVKREQHSRGGSVSLIDDAPLGFELEVSAPMNVFRLDDRAKRAILIAGGIGITPILAMALHLARQGKPFHVYYLTRDAAGTAFKSTLQNPPLQGHVTLHHDQGQPEHGFDLWPVLEKPGSLTGTHVYCCGPAGLMQSVRDMTGHWPNACVHFEHFNARAAQREDDQPFVLVLTDSGTEVTVPAGQSMLEAARQVGASIASSCESGSCGACKTRLVQGEADHRDHVLLPEERTSWVMPCVSRARGDRLSIQA